MSVGDAVCVSMACPGEKKTKDYDTVRVIDNSIIVLQVCRDCVYIRVCVCVCLLRAWVSVEYHVTHMCA